MKKVLLIDNFDSFTFNLADYLECEGLEVKSVRNTVAVDFVDTYKPDLIVFSPGPGSPETAGNMIEMIKTYTGKYPMFGVCLGLQAMILAYGGTLKKVHPHHGKQSVINTVTDPLFEDISRQIKAGRYHSLAADVVPSCLKIIATTDDNIVMAVKHESELIYGVQFHPESILTAEQGVGRQIIRNLIAMI